MCQCAGSANSEIGNQGRVAVLWLQHLSDVPIYEACGMRVLWTLLPERVYFSLLISFSLISKAALRSCVEQGINSMLLSEIPSARFAVFGLHTMLLGPELATFLAKECTMAEWFPQSIVGAVGQRQRVMVMVCRR